MSNFGRQRRNTEIGRAFITSCNVGDHPAALRTSRTARPPYLWENLLDFVPSFIFSEVGVPTISGWFSSENLPVEQTLGTHGQIAGIGSQTTETTGSK